LKFFAANAAKSSSNGDSVTPSSKWLVAPKPVNAVESSIGSGEEKLRPLPPHVIYVDLRYDFDMDLLKRFYDDLMVPNFPLADELDSMEYMESMLREADEDDNESSSQAMTVANPASAASKPPAAAAVDFHILLMLSFPTAPEPGKRPNYGEAAILGGVVFEYYTQANVGLLTYLLVGSKYRGMRLGFILTEKCRESLESNAKSRGHLAGCNAIFLETNSATKVKASNDVMPPALRHQIFFKMGLRLVDFDYVQAPLASDKKKVNYLLLCCFITPRIPSMKIGNEDNYFLPSTLLRNAIHAIWANAPSKGSRKYTDDVDFKRMLDQLNRRERIALLDLPWDRPFTIVDLHEHFDLELLVTFYQDILLPCYRDRMDELDSLDAWLELLSPKHKNPSNPLGDMVEFHLLLALQYSEDEEENSKPMIAGGLAFEYYPGNNCGFLTYLLVPVGERGERMARALIDSALEELDTAAKHRGQLGGCNVIYMESRTTPLTTNPNLEVQDIEQQHPLLEAMGWKMLDFDYVQPPNSDPLKKVKTSILMVFVTPRIPMLVQEDVRMSYLPRSTLKKFLMELWECSCGMFPGFDFRQDRDFVEMMEQLERRTRIPLLGRPWNKPWTLVDLQENSNVALLKQFFVEMVEPNYHTHKEDLEPLEIWQKRLIATNQAQINNQAAPELSHVLMAVRPSAEADSVPMLLGGLAFKYFEATNCGFITYALLKNVDSRESVAKALSERALDILDQDAVGRGNLAGCNAIFLETSDPNLAWGDKAKEKTIDMSLQHALLHKLGWRLVDFNYVAPPQRPGRKPLTLRSLAMFLTPRIPRVSMSNPEDTYFYVPRAMLISFMHDYWKVSCASSGYDFDQDPDFLAMMDLIERRERIPLLELPWERPWTLVDLWEDFDAQLLYKFYQNFYASSFPDKADREPLSKWLQLLSDENRENPSIEDFHVILALMSSRPAVRAGPGGAPSILGGVTFSFSTSISCGLMTYLSVPKQSAELMVRNLIDEATVAVNENAVLRGHIAGCNAIFMELPVLGFAGNNVTHEMIFKTGWRMLNLPYFQPPQNIYSAGGAQHLLLALVTQNVPREPVEGKPGQYVYFLPTDLVRTFIWHHWRDAYQRIGKSQVTKDPNYQRMMAALESVSRVTLLELPWTSAHATAKL
jgi:hypothetical protein